MSFSKKSSFGICVLSASLSALLLSGCGGGNEDAGMGGIYVTDKIVSPASKGEVVVEQRASLLEHYSYINIKPTVQPTMQDMDANIDKRLRDTVKEFSDRNNLTGIQFVVKDGDKLWIGNYGYADIDKEIPLTTEHVFKAGSVTKTFVASLILKLQEEGLLNIDDPLSKYSGLNLPSSWPNLDRITIRNLLNHTSGIPNYMDEAWGNKMNFTEKEVGRTLDEKLEYMRSIVKPNAEAFESKMWIYSNTNYILLAKIAELVTNSDYYSLMKSKIIDPVGLKYTQVPKAGTTKSINNLVRGYRNTWNNYGFTKDSPELNQLKNAGITLEDGLQDVTEIEISYAVGDGDFVSNALDLAKWFDERANGDLLSEGSIAISRDMKFVGDHRPGWKYGIGYYELFDGFYTHRGQFPGYECGVEESIKDGAIFSMCTNRTLLDGGTLDYTIFQQIASAYYNSKVENAADIRSRIIDRKLGEYEFVDYNTERLPLNEY